MMTRRRKLEVLGEVYRCLDWLFNVADDEFAEDDRYDAYEDIKKLLAEVMENEVDEGDEEKDPVVSFLYGVEELVDDIEDDWGRELVWKSKSPWKRGIRGYQWNWRELGKLIENVKRAEGVC